jgi:hypothetical protein
LIRRKEAQVRRIALVVAVSAIGAAVPSAASAQGPPQSPPGCNVVITKPAATTGSQQGQEQKFAAYQRVCLGG